MIFVSETTFVLVVSIVQILGLLSLASIRLGSRWHQCQLCQLLFFFSLALVGGATMLCLHCRMGVWVFCSITLSVMVVGAVFDAGSGGVSYRMTRVHRAS
jgi:hypothetical protein